MNLFYSSSFHSYYNILNPVLRILMRSVALSFIALAASGALAQSEAPKPTFAVSLHISSAIIPSNYIPSPPLLKLLSLNSSQKIGLNVGHLRRQLRRPPSVAKLSAMSENGMSRIQPFLSLRAIRVSLPKAKLPTTPYLLPSPHLLTSRTNL